MFNGITSGEIAHALEAAESVELKAFGLLKQAAPGSIFPRGLDRTVYFEATVEMIQYSEACAKLADRVIQNAESLPMPAGDHEAELAGYSL